jgi:CPA2 family monovalent cation:H+ antiporter-2
MEGITELAVVFIFSLLGLIAAVRLRLPPIIGILLAGALIGPNALGFVRNSEVISSFSEIGAILLLFAIGIEFSLNKIMKFGVRAILVAFAKITFVFVAVYEVSIMLGLSQLEAIILGNLFAITSTTLFSKLIKGGHEHNKEEINIMFAVLILEDIFAVFVLAVISSLPGGSELVINNLALSILKSLVILILTYLVVQKTIRAFFDYILKFKTEEMLVFASLSICILFALLSSAIGLEASIGAFLAGSLMASLKEFKKIEKTILPFGLFFSAFFFLSIGMLVDFGMLWQNLPIIVILVIVSMLAKFAIIAANTYFLGFTSRAAVFSGLTMLTIGEFSLLIAMKAQPLMSFDIIGTVSASVFITALLSAFVMRREIQIDDMITDAIPLKLRTSGRHISRYINSVIVEFEPNGKFFRESMGEMKNIAINSTMLIVINTLFFVVEEQLQNFGILSFEEGIMLWVKVIFHILISFGLTVALLRSIDRIVTDFMAAFRKIDSKHTSLERRIILDAVNVMALLAVSTALPVFIAVLELPTFFGALSLVTVGLAVLYTWDGIKCAHELVKNMTRKKKSYKPKAYASGYRKGLMNLAMFLNV